MHYCTVAQILSPPQILLLLDPIVVDITLLTSCHCCSELVADSSIQSVRVSFTFDLFCRKIIYEMPMIRPSSSSDRVDSKGPLRQPGVATTTSLGPFGTNAEGCTIADLLDP